MFVTRLMTAGALVLALGTAGAGVGVMARLAPGSGAAGMPQVASPVEGQNAERKPRPVEEKPDQGRPPAAPQDQPAPDRSAQDETLKLIIQARDHVENMLNLTEQQLFDLRQKRPFLLWTMGGQNGFAERLGQLNAKMTELQLRRNEAEALRELIRPVLEEKEPTAAEWKAKALLLLLQRRGIDVAALRKAMGSGSDVDLVRLYDDSLQLERRELESLMSATQDLQDKTVKLASEFVDYELKEEHLRNKLKQTRELYDSLVKRFHEIAYLRAVEKKP
jgi:hypothetical protein